MLNLIKYGKELACRFSFQDILSPRASDLLHACGRAQGLTGKHAQQMREPPRTVAGLHGDGAFPQQTFR